MVRTFQTKALIQQDFFDKFRTKSIKWTPLKNKARKEMLLRKLHSVSLLVQFQLVINSICILEVRLPFFLGVQCPSGLYYSVTLWINSLAAQFKLPKKLGKIHCISPKLSSTLVSALGFALAFIGHSCLFFLKEFLERSKLCILKPFLRRMHPGSTIEIIQSQHQVWKNKLLQSRKVQVKKQALVCRQWV